MRLRRRSEEGSQKTVRPNRRRSNHADSPTCWLKGWDGAAKATKPKRAELTLSLAEDDRMELEAIATSEGVTMATLVRIMVSERKARAEG